MTKTVLFELGLEEMPARFMDDAVDQLQMKTEAWLKEQRIPYGSVKIFSTPRRLAVKISEAADKQPDVEEEAKGPAKKIALNEEGEWSKAAIGFSKGQGKSVEDIYFKEINGTEYVHINKFIAGKNTIHLLKEFQDVFLNITFPKNMRWGNLDLRYARPIRWIAALYGEEVIPLEIANVTADRFTFGHRFLGKRVEFPSAESYEDVLKAEYVIADANARKETILAQLKELERSKGWKLILDEDLLTEVTHLVEYPTVFSGSFQDEFLQVPEEALITSMKEHQRYFPVRNQTGELLPYFAGVRNGDENYIENVSKGNEKVLRARLADAQFFFEEDQKGTLEEKTAKLTRMVFQEELGTLHDKAMRVNEIAEKISNLLNLEDREIKQAKRAAQICKFDLVTHMVDEFTELQGIMGEKYARIFGEDEAVARAINEHYMPRQANGELPETLVGSIVSIADKLDTIIGSIAIGIIPTGSQDPYGLRRQALGVLQTLQKQGWSIRVETLLDLVLSMYQELGLPTRPHQEIAEDIQEFFKVRAAYLLREENMDPDIVEAVLAKGIQIFPVTLKKAVILGGKRQDEAFKPVHEALGRVLNIAKKADSNQVNPELFANESETNLYAAFQSVHSSYQQAMTEERPEDALDELSKLTEPIHAFFDHTMVMDENDQIRTNRLALLNQIAEDITLFADLNEVQWKQQY